MVVTVHMIHASGEDGPDVMIVARTKQVLRDEFIVKAREFIYGRTPEDFKEKMDAVLARLDEANPDVGVNVELTKGWGGPQYRIEVLE